MRFKLYKISVHPNWCSAVNLVLHIDAVLNSRCMHSWIIYKKSTDHDKDFHPCFFETDLRKLNNKFIQDTDETERKTKAICESFFFFTVSVNVLNVYMGCTDEPLKAFSHCAAFVLGSVRVFETESVFWSIFLQVCKLFTVYGPTPFPETKEERNKSKQTFRKKAMWLFQCIMVLM